MSFILAATDFSDISRKAVNYACMMAEHYNTSVVITHSFVIPVSFNYDVPLPAMQLEEGQKMAEQKMGEFTSNLKAEYPDLKIDTQIVYGTIVDALYDYTEKESKPWLIVIGNDNSAENGKWLDDTVVDALKELRYPVLAIPPNAVFKPARKICLAYDAAHAGITFPTAEINSFISGLGSEVHVLTVSKDDDKKDAATTLDLQSLNAAYHFIESEHTDETICDFVDNNGMDWLAIVPHKHSFFEGLFHRSHTNAITRLSHVPVLAFHEVVKEN